MSVIPTVTIFPEFTSQQKNRTSQFLDHQLNKKLGDSSILTYREFTLVSAYGKVTVTQLLFLQ